MCKLLYITLFISMVYCVRSHIVPEQHDIPEGVLSLLEESYKKQFLPLLFAAKNHERNELRQDVLFLINDYFNLLFRKLQEMRYEYMNTYVYYNPYGIGEYHRENNYHGNTNNNNDNNHNYENDQNHRNTDREEKKIGDDYDFNKNVKEEITFAYGTV